MRSCASGIERGDILTIIEVRNRLQRVAIGVERLWLTNTTIGVLVGVQDDLGINEIPCRYSLVQSLAESSGGCHLRKKLVRAGNSESRVVFIGRLRLACVRKRAGEGRHDVILGLDAS